MESGKRGEATAISIQEPKYDTKGKAVATDAAAPVINLATKATRRGGRGKGLAIFDFTLRLSAITAGFAATAIMGTTEQTLPFFTQFFQFHAEYNDIPTLRLFVISNAVASGYLVLSLPFSIICMVRPQSRGPRLLLIMFDTIVMALTIAAASAATAILDLAHNGNPSANWIPICQQFKEYCQQASSAVVASFVASFMFILLILLSAVALKRN